MSEKTEIERLTKQFNLIPHPGGGAFTPVWRSDRNITFTEPTAHDGPRCANSSIYSLMVAPGVQTWRTLLSDELLFWHAGGTVKVNLLDKEGKYSSVLMGDTLKNAECAYQVLIPHDYWYAFELIDKEYIFFSATVSPGFDMKDWTEGSREDMLKRFPQHADLITRLTKK